jgi:hypothetical protein
MRIAGSLNLLEHLGYDVYDCFGSHGELPVVSSEL